MGEDLGEGEGGGAEAPEPPLRPVEAGALRAAVRLDEAAIRCPAEAGREAGDWRLAAIAGNALVAAATGVAAVTGAAAVGTGVALVGTGVTAAIGAATSTAFTAAVTADAGGEVAAATGALTSVPIAGTAGVAGLAAAAPGTTCPAAPDWAEDRVRAVRLAIVHVGERNWSGGEGPCTG